MKLFSFRRKPHRYRRSTELHFQKKDTTADRRRAILIWSIEIAAAAAVAFLAVVFFGTQVRCTDDSMQPRIESGSTVLVNSLCGRTVPLHRGDVVVFYLEDRSSRHPYIRRIAGLPGETVQISDGQLLINGTPLTKGIKTDSLAEAGIAAQPVTLSSDEYFVLGDSPDGDEDSRTSEIGNIRKSEIKGKVWFTLLSDGRTGFVN